MPSLLSVNGNRTELKPNRCYVLGRAADCDVIVQDMAGSRHHAQLIIGSDPGAILLEDLGSRNGTYVNEESVKGRIPVLDGARIRIGATIYLVTMLEEGEVDDPETLDTGTIALEKLSLGTDLDEKLLRVAKRRERSNTEIAGQLSSFTLIDVLQLLMQTNRSGALHVEVDGGHATVQVRNGDVHACTFAGLDGFTALVRLVREKAGIFWLIERIIPCKRTIHQPAATLLLELCRAIDEENAG